MIWGFAFVAQRIGMDYVGPFTFNAVRFALGGLSLVPLLLITRGKKPSKSASLMPLAGTRTLFWGGVLTGGILFAGASLQQVGLLYTTAGKAGFITGLYVVIVPILGLFWRQKTDAGTWIGVFLAAIGLYLLSVTEAFTISFGDFLQLAGALFWASHVLVIGWLSPRINAIRLAFWQFMVCSTLSLITAICVETIAFEGIVQAAIPILYGGVGSVGIAYTLQVVAQQDAKPAHAAIIMSLETVFAAIGGWLLLDELLSTRSLVGCGFMLTGMLISQLWNLSRS
jgi:drug/metabolite transporter (DMT)-like permease